MGRNMFILNELTSKSVFLAFLILFFKVSATFGQDCLRCDDFNREQSIKCALNYGDCGPCKSGFIEDPDDSRLCFAIELLESSESQQKNKGDDVYLPCKFNAAINCVWTKDGTEVNVASNNNYVWSNNGNGLNTDDCSINIKQLSFDDVGEWQCSNKANSDYDSKKSTPIIISIPANVETHPDSIYRVGSGVGVTVACTFDQEVKCSWMKNGRPIKSRDNYIFNEKEKSRDCALTIKFFDVIKDGGNWTCLTPGTSEAKAIVASTAQLIADPNAVREGQKNISPSENKSKPVISYKDETVNRKILQLSSENVLNGLRCSAETGEVVSLNWLVHDDVEYPGLRVGNSIYLDKILTNNIMDRLKTNQNIDLFCLVKYANKQTELSLVTLAKSAQYDDSLGQIDTANLNSLLIVLIVVIVILMGGILGGLICLACYFMNHRHSHTSETSEKTSREGVTKETNGRDSVHGETDSVGSQTPLLAIKTA